MHSYSQAHETWQEERFYLYVSMPYVSVEKVRVYLGCSICGKRSMMGEAANFHCINCANTKAECVPRYTSIYCKHKLILC